VAPNCHFGSPHLTSAATLSTALQVRIRSHRWDYSDLHRWWDKGIAPTFIVPRIQLTAILFARSLPWVSGQSEFAVLPIYNKRTNLPSGHGNHDGKLNNRSWWIVDCWGLVSRECTLVWGIVLLLSKSYVYSETSPSLDSRKSTLTSKWVECCNWQHLPLQMWFVQQSCCAQTCTQGRWPVRWAD